MKDPLSYTYDGLERELNLLEIHLKEAPEGDEAFCKDCIDKHIQTSRGYALEGPGFTKDKEEQKRFLDAEKKLREIKDQNYKEKGVELSQKVRELRKSLVEECSNCKTLSKSEIENLSKDLNNPNTSFILADENHTQNSEAELNLDKNKMKIDYAKLGMMNAGQFAAEGVRYLSETYPTATPGQYDKYITIGGGLGLQALGVFLKKPAILKPLLLVAGSNLLAGGVVKLIKAATTPTVAVTAAKVNAGNMVAGYPGKSFSYAPAFGGPTFAGKVTAKNIPTQYTRAGILSGAQAFEAPEHADLIRVD